MDNWVPLAGVVMAQFVLVGLFFVGQRAEDERRWHEKRLDAYRDLSRASRMASEVFALAEAPEDLDDRRLVEAVNAADSCMLDIDLLSSPEVREAATALHTWLEMCVVFDAGSQTFPKHEDLLTGRFEFERAVRKELGVKEPTLSKEDRELIAAVEAVSEPESGPPHNLR
jgi:hypothetical protein